MAPAPGGDDDEVAPDIGGATVAVTPGDLALLSKADALAPAAPRPGDVLGARFSILRRIGDGGTGTVFAARDGLLGEDVALKLLHRGTDGDSLRRLRDEVRAARRIAHPNVCRVHDLAEVGGRVFVVMELLGGDTLRERMRKGVGVGEALEILRQLAAGLAAAHRAGVVHCDVKPENALFAGELDGRPRVALTDFGIARFVGPAPLRGDDELIEGTPAYMSPEQLNGAAVDERSDVYALAVLASELLTRAHPFGITAGITFMTLTRRVLTERPRFPPDQPAELAPEARAALVAALERGLRVAPTERYDGVAALVAAIAAAVGPVATTRATTAPPAEPDGALRTPTPRRPATGARGVRRVATIAHVLVEPIGHGDDEERAVERVEAMLDVAEAALVDAGGAIVARVPRGLVAVFGATRSAGDEPLRAADATRALVVAAPSGEVAVRAGIDTGRVLVRQAPSGALTVAGDALSAASGLAQAAAPSEVRASERAARHLARRFVLEPAAAGARRVVARRPASAADRGAPLVGRDSELARLIEALAAVARAGRPRAALLLGPPGVGKSRLRGEVADALASRGFRVLAASAAPDDMLTPYAVLHALVAELPPLAPELPVRAAARAALAAAAAARPLLVVVDDAHWADDATLDVVDAVARGELEAPVALLVEARADLLERRPRTGDGWALRLEIGPLPRERAAELAAACLGAAATPEAVAAVVDVAEGNPFYVEELARDHVERAGAAPGTPSTVEEAIQARLDRLGGDARELLRAAAVLGTSFRRVELVELVDAARDAVSLDARALDPLLGELDERRVLDALRPDAGADDRWAFRHALIRDVAYRELAPAPRRALHAAAARLLAALRPDTHETDVGRDRERLSELARHLEGADERTAAADAYRRAGDLAAAQGAPADALRSLRRARALAGDGDAELLLAIGGAAASASEFAEADAVLELILARPGVDAVVAARACLTRANVAKQRAQWAESAALARRGLALIADLDEPVVAALLHGILGWVVAYILGDVGGGLAECLRAVELLAGTPHLAELAAAYSMLGAAYMRAGRWRDQLRCNRRNLEIGEKLGAIELIMKANLNLGVNLTALGETAEAIACSRTALALNQRMCMPALVGLARNNLALALIDAGQLDEAERELDEAQRLSELCGGLYYRTEVAQGRVRIAARRGRLDAALEHAAEALRLAASPTDEGIGRRLRGVVLSMAGRHDEAAAELVTAARALGDADLGETARLLADQGRAALRRGAAAAETLLADAGGRLAALGAALDAQHLRDLSWI